MKPNRKSVLPNSSSRSRWAVVAFLAGLIGAIIALRSLPPAPIYSPYLKRANYWQSYETSYFASLRAYEEPIKKTLTDGNIPIVIFGDSTLRGTGAIGEDVWSRLLEKQLQEVNSRVRVLNYSQNAGDLMGPFLYHHLQQKYPEARYIVQWHFSSIVGIRHQFHFWLTSEIALLDGNNNPAVAQSFETVPVTRTDERYSFVMAALNIATNYLDVGNWVRYLWLGRPYFDADRRVKISALRDATESDTSYTHFTAVDEEQAQQMQGYFLAHQEARQKYIMTPLSDRRAYFEKMYPSSQRSHLLLLTLDFNPYYAPHEDPEAMKTWRSIWEKLRAEMGQISDLNWVSLTGALGELEVDDFFDLGHLTISGQQKLAKQVAAHLLAPGNWFDPETPGSEKLPEPLNGQWFETKNLKPYQLTSFAHMEPLPSKFFSSFGPGLDKTLFGAHPTTRLVFQVPAGNRRLQTTVQINPDAYTNLSLEQATDGIQFEIAILDSQDRRRVVFTREIDPFNQASDRGIVTIDETFTVRSGDKVEVFIGPGKENLDTRDWAQLGPLVIR